MNGKRNYIIRRFLKNLKVSPIDRQHNCVHNIFLKFSHQSTYLFLSQQQSLFDLTQRRQQINQHDNSLSSFVIFLTSFEIFLEKLEDRFQEGKTGELFYNTKLFDSAKHKNSKRAKDLMNFS